MSDFIFTIFMVAFVVWILPATQTFEPKLYDEAVSKCENNQGVKKIQLTDYENNVYCVNGAKFSLETKK